tara:strand:+ start:1454 stop:2038 length:585 start_codon:yes stop_codon:yes gene_type:complete
MFFEDEKVDEKKEEELTHNVNEPAVDDETSTDSNDNNQDSENSEDAIEDLSKKYDETYDALLRAQAEIENIKKRTIKEVENAHKYSIESILQEIIPIYESLSLSCSLDQTNVDIGKVLEGNKMLLNMFQKIFDQNNIKEINPLNEKFDPKYHQAISTIKDAKLANDTVSEVVQKGYLLNERVIKPALVLVIKNN